MAGLELYKSDDTTSAAAAYTISTSGGVASAAQVIHAWFNKGVNGGSQDGIYYQIEVEYPASSGTYVTSGVNALNGHFEARFNGGNNAANASGFVATTSDWVKLGPASVLLSPTMYGNTSRYVEVRYSPPLSSGAASETINWRLVPYYSNASFEIASGVPQLGVGILTGVCDPTVREFHESPSVAAAGTPDATVIIGRYWYVWDGVPYRNLGETITLNQNDSVPSALTSGQAYIAVVSRDQSGAITVTKGTRATAASAVAPACPAGEIPVARIIVNYNASASVINNSDITKLALDGRLKPRAGTGLTGIIGSGRAVMSGSFVRLTGETTVTLTASSTNRVWLLSSGTFTVVTTDNLPPVSGALWIATFTTDGSGVTATTDKRTFCEPLAQIVTLKRDGTEATATTADRVMLGYAFCIDRMTAALRVASSGGATGSTTLDVNKYTAGSGATVFTNQGGATESRPKIAASGYTDTTPYLEVTTGEPGDWLTLDVDAITSGGTQATDIGVSIVVYPQLR